MINKLLIPNQMVKPLIMITIVVFLSILLLTQAKEDSFPKDQLGTYFRMPIRRAIFMRPPKYIYRSQENDYDVDREAGWPFIPKRSGVDPLFGVTVGKRSVDHHLPYLEESSDSQLGQESSHGKFF